MHGQVYHHNTATTTAAAAAAQERILLLLGQWVVGMKGKVRRQHLVAKVRMTMSLHFESDVTLVTFYTYSFTCTIIALLNFQCS